MQNLQRDFYLAAITAPGVNVIDVEWTSVVKPAAAHKARALTKRVSATVLTGVEFKDLAVNNDRQTGDLPWGQWDVYPYIVTHGGNLYARLNVVEGTVKASYAVDGAPATKAEFDAFLTPAARKPSRPVGGTITVKVNHLTIK